MKSFKSTLRRLASTVESAEARRAPLSSSPLPPSPGSPAGSTPSPTSPTAPALPVNPLPMTPYLLDPALTFADAALLEPSTLIQASRLEPLGDPLGANLVRDAVALLSPSLPLPKRIKALSLVVRALRVFVVNRWAVLWDAVEDLTDSEDEAVHYAAYEVLDAVLGHQSVSVAHARALMVHLEDKLESSDKTLMVTLMTRLFHSGKAVALYGAAAIDKIVAWLAVTSREDALPTSLALMKLATGIVQHSTGVIEAGTSKAIVVRVVRVGLSTSSTRLAMAALSVMDGVVGARLVSQHGGLLAPVVLLLSRFVTLPELTLASHTLITRLCGELGEAAVVSAMLGIARSPGNVLKNIGALRGIVFFATRLFVEVPSAASLGEVVSSIGVIVSAALEHLLVELRSGPSRAANALLSSQSLLSEVALVTTRLLKSYPLPSQGSDDAARFLELIQSLAWFVELYHSPQTFSLSLRLHAMPNEEGPSSVAPTPVSSPSSLLPSPPALAAAAEEYSAQFDAILQVCEAYVVETPNVVALYESSFICQAFLDILQMHKDRLSGRGAQVIASLVLGSLSPLVPDWVDRAARFARAFVVSETRVPVLTTALGGLARLYETHESVYGAELIAQVVLPALTGMGRVPDDPMVLQQLHGVLRTVAMTRHTPTLEAVLGILVDHMSSTGSPAMLAATTLVSLFESKVTDLPVEHAQVVLSTLTKLTSVAPSLGLDLAVRSHLIQSLLRVSADGAYQITWRDTSMPFVTASVFKASRYALGLVPLGPVLHTLLDVLVTEPKVELFSAALSGLTAFINNMAVMECVDVTHVALRLCSLLSGPRFAAAVDATYALDDHTLRAEGYKLLASLVEYIARTEGDVTSTQHIPRVIPGAAASRSIVSRVERVGRALDALREQYHWDEGVLTAGHVGDRVLFCIQRGLGSTAMNVVNASLGVLNAMMHTGLWEQARARHLPAVLESVVSVTFPVFVRECAGELDTLFPLAPTHEPGGVDAASGGTGVGAVSTVSAVSGQDVRRAAVKDPRTLVPILQFIGSLTSFCTRESGLVSPAVLDGLSKVVLRALALTLTSSGVVDGCAPPVLVSLCARAVLAVGCVADERTGPSILSRLSKGMWQVFHRTGVADSRPLLAQHVQFVLWSTESTLPVLLFAGGMVAAPSRLPLPSTASALWASPAGGGTVCSITAADRGSGSPWSVMTVRSGSGAMQWMVGLENPSEALAPVAPPTVAGLDLLAHYPFRSKGREHQVFKTPIRSSDAFDMDGEPGTNRSDEAITSLVGHLMIPSAGGNDEDAGSLTSSQASLGSSVSVSPSSSAWRWTDSYVRPPTDPNSPRALESPNFAASRKSRDGRVRAARKLALTDVDAVSSEPEAHASDAQLMEHLRDEPAAPRNQLGISLDMCSDSVSSSASSPLAGVPPPPDSTRPSSPGVLVLSQPAAVAAAGAAVERAPLMRRGSRSMDAIVGSVSSPVLSDKPKAGPASAASGPGARGGGRGGMVCSGSGQHDGASVGTTPRSHPELVAASLFPGAFTQSGDDPREWVQLRDDVDVSLVDAAIGHVDAMDRAVSVHSVDIVFVDGRGSELCGDALLGARSFAGMMDVLTEVGALCRDSGVRGGRGGGRWVNKVSRVAFGVPGLDGGPRLGTTRVQVVVHERAVGALNGSSVFPIGCSVRIAVWVRGGMARVEVQIQPHVQSGTALWGSIPTHMLVSTRSLGMMLSHLVIVVDDIAFAASAGLEALSNGASRTRELYGIVEKYFGGSKGSSTSLSSNGPRGGAGGAGGPSGSGGMSLGLGSGHDSDGPWDVQVVETSAPRYSVE